MSRNYYDNLDEDYEDIKGFKTFKYYERNKERLEFINKYVTDEYHIYKVTDKKTGKIYIGKSNNLNPFQYGGGRKMIEIQKEYFKEKYNRELTDIETDITDLNEYFEKEYLLHFKDSKEANAWKCQLIELFNSTDSEIGYNIAEGAKNILRRKWSIPAKATVWYYEYMGIL